MDAPNPTSLQIEPVVGALRVAVGARLDATPCIAVLTPPPLAPRSREDERVFILLDLTGPASPHLYRELREVASQAYWATTSSITAALRQAAAAVNRYLFDFNLRTASSDRCYGGFACAVLHDEDLFILQAGPVRVCVLHGSRLECFHRGEDLPHLGMATLAEMRLYHTFAAHGNTLLLASSTLAQAAGDADLARVLPRADVQEVVAGLEQVGTGADFAALVVRLSRPSLAPLAAAAREPPRPSRPGILARLRRQGEPPPPEARPTPAAAPPIRRPEPTASPAKPPRPTRPAPARRPGPNLGEQVKRAAAAAGRGVATAAAGLAGGVSTLFRRMLPGPEREAARRARPPRPAPKENRTVMMATAIGILVLMVIAVVSAYSTFGQEERFKSKVKQIRGEIALAQDANVPEEARLHWEAALKHAEEALGERPDNAEVADLYAQTQTALDQLDGVIRLAPIHLKKLEPASEPRPTDPHQLVVHGQSIFVLDPKASYAIELTLNQTNDGLVEQEIPPPFVSNGKQIDEGVVGNLVDFVWIEPGGERLRSGLVILEENGVLVTYDPAWGGEGGDRELTRAFLGTPPAGTPRAVDSFEGRFYILDVTENQVWRYEPRGDVYPDHPDRYFVTPPPRSLEDAVDMAIDGNVYVLHSDGAISKFLRGEPQPFDVRGVPGGISHPVALAIDPAGSSGRVYVADRGDGETGGRVIVLEGDGAFSAQFRADGAFDALEALVVNEAVGRLYVFSGGQLYLAALP